MTANEDQSRNEHGSAVSNAEGNGNENASASSSAGGGKTGTKSSSPKPSPSSWNNAQIHRGRSRTRGVGSNRDEQNGLRRFVCSFIAALAVARWRLAERCRSKRIPCVAFFVWEGV